jgi:translation initiation factor IF-1|tara:strand:- start:2901 stop:3422 length:522 start_codon:yes stop_codon:yes gene_type:complete
MIKIIDNFLDFNQEYYRLCKTLQYYNPDDFEKLTKERNEYPGVRTDFLDRKYPFLFYSVLGYIKNKFDIDLKNYDRIRAHAQLRLSKHAAEDWIHRDWGDTILIYLSPTNLKSGTAFYRKIGEDKYEETGIARYVQNRAVFFSNGTFHMAINNHGNNIEDGRLTLTYFLTKED